MIGWFTGRRKLSGIDGSKGYYIIDVGGWTTWREPMKITETMRVIRADKLETGMVIYGARGVFQDTEKISVWNSVNTVAKQGWVVVSTKRTPLTDERITIMITSPDSMGLRATTSAHSTSVATEFWIESTDPETNEYGEVGL